MNSPASSLYHGEAVHRRLRPVCHELRYTVFNIFADIDDLAGLSRRLRFFNHNRFNIFSIADRDHGQGDGTPIRDHVWKLVKASDAGAEVGRIFMFCYPRVFGYVFNPLTAYYGFETGGRLRLMIYEVNNTFGQRHSYVIPVDGATRQSCAKQLYVSPFNKVEGHYDFGFQTPGEELKLSVALSTQEGPCLNAWFIGKRVPLADAALLRSFLGLPLLPLRIIGGIHWEVVKLWWKGLRLVRRPLPPEQPVTIARSARETE